MNIKEVREMGCYNNCGKCSLSCSQKIIIWGALITLILNEALSEEGKELTGNLLASIGDLLLTAQVAGGTCCTTKGRDCGYL